MADRRAGRPIDERLRELDPRERQNLDALAKRMRGARLTPRLVGETLPEAVLIGDEGSRPLSRSMTGITERAIAASVEDNPEALSTALFPIIGAAIRKALNKMLAEMMESMNSGLERAFSFKRLGWRFESWKTGTPFVEIVLRETLRYRVEHVFLIHSKTGLLLREASPPGVVSPDSDMVASMLEAVREYIKDSLALAKTDAVQSIRTGSYALLVEDGPYASIALFVRGSPDPSLRNAAQEAVETIHLRLGSRLKSFSGDVGPFEEADPALRRCLLSQDTRAPGGKPVYAIVALSAILLAAMTAVGFGIAAARSREAFERALDEEPGIVLVDSRRSRGRRVLRVLRDPGAATVAELAEGMGVDAAAFVVEEESYWSPELRPGVPVAEDAPLVVPEELLELARRLGGIVILFEQDSGELRTGQQAAIRAAGDLLSELIGKSRAYGLDVSVDIVGHAAGEVQDEAGLRVSEERAQKALAMFAELNAPLVDYVRPVGVGVAEPVAPTDGAEDERALNRSVTFKAIFR